MDNNSKFKKVAVMVGLGLWILVLTFMPRDETKSVLVWREARTKHMISTNLHMDLLWIRSIYTLDNSSGNACVAMDGFLFVMGSEKQIGKLKMIAIKSLVGKRDGRQTKCPDFHIRETNYFLRTE